MKPLWPVLGGLLAIGALTYFCALHHRPHFEADLTARGQSALAAIALRNVSVSADGQVLILRGEVPSADLKFLAGAAAARVFGVEAVENRLSVVTPPSPPEAAKALTGEEKVTAIACQAEFSSMLAREQIRFVSGQPAIDALSFPLLDRLAAAAAHCPAVSFEVAGHTDSEGPLDFNTSLSKARAEAVAGYLVRKGVPVERMTVAGYGPSQPIGDNQTSQGREKNRRTEFKVKGI
jgi:outer membrane protein OmpA-like peptidoglycan-associated protein